MLASSVAVCYFPAAILNGQFLESNDHAFAHRKLENPALAGQTLNPCFLCFLISH